MTTERKAPGADYPDNEPAGVIQRASTEVAALTTASSAQLVAVELTYNFGPSGTLTVVTR